MPQYKHSSLTAKLVLRLEQPDGSTKDYLLGEIGTAPLAEIVEKINLWGLKPNTPAPYDPSPYADPWRTNPW